MCNWLILATWYRRDGTPVPDRKLVTLVSQGDPLAIAFVATVVLCVVGRAIYRSFHKP
jgi:hypothetical protein